MFIDASPLCTGRSGDYKVPVCVANYTLIYAVPAAVRVRWRRRRHGTFSRREKKRICRIINRRTVRRARIKVERARHRQVRVRVRARGGPTECTYGSR
jgi:hypothetical protein